MGWLEKVDSGAFGEAVFAQTMPNTSTCGKKQWGLLKDEIN